MKRTNTRSYLIISQEPTQAACLVVCSKYKVYVVRKRQLKQSIVYNHPISVEHTAWRLLPGIRNLCRGCRSLGKLHLSIIVLAVSAWILNGSWIEWHEKKRQPFSLSGARYGSRAILISGWKSASRRGGQKWAFHPCLLLIRKVTVNAKPTKSLKFAI